MEVEYFQRVPSVSSIYQLCCYTLVYNKKVVWLRATGLLSHWWSFRSNEHLGEACSLKTSSILVCVCSPGPIPPITWTSTPPSPRPSPPLPQSHPHLGHNPLPDLYPSYCPHSHVVISQTISWVSQKRLSSEAGISLFIETFHAIDLVVVLTIQVRCITPHFSPTRGCWPWQSFQYEDLSFNSETDHDQNLLRLLCNAIQ